MTEARTILFAGGGTGGHLYPGVAVADALRGRLPGGRPLFLCTKRPIDQVILEPTGFEFIPQPIVPPRTSIGGLLRFWKSWRETKDQVRQLLTERRPAAVVGLGGYAAGVAVKLAAGRGIPTVILNPDVIPGRANVFLMRHARAVCCQFAETADHVSAEHQPKLRVTGCPIRADIIHLPDRPAALDRLRLDPLLRTLVVTGASLGAQTVNEAVLSLLAELPMDGWQVLHLAGRDHAAAVRAGYEKLPAVRATVVDFRGQQLRRADRDRRAVGVDAVPVPQGHAPAGQRRRPGRRRCRRPDRRRQGRDGQRRPAAAGAGVADDGCRPTDRHGRRRPPAGPAGRGRGRCRRGRRTRRRGLSACSWRRCLAPSG
jgi:UDP-N-acetylglucosamine:LPS N-acetylglucosamine transferase